MENPGDSRDTYTSTNVALLATTSQLRCSGQDLFLLSERSQVRAAAQALLPRRVHFAYGHLANVSFCLQNRQIDT
jgi:hypothetical protein